MNLTKKLVLNISKLKSSTNLSTIIDGLLEIQIIICKFNDELADYINFLINSLVRDYQYLLTFDQQIKHLQYYINLRDFETIRCKLNSLNNYNSTDYKVERNRIELIYKFSNNTITEVQIEEYIKDYENSSKKPVFTSIYYELYRHNLHNHYKAMLYYSLEVSENYNQKLRRVNADLIFPEICLDTLTKREKQINKLENCLSYYLKNENYSSYIFTLCRLSLEYAKLEDKKLAQLTLDKAILISKYLEVSSIKSRIEDIKSKFYFLLGEYEKVISILKELATKNRENKMPYYLVATYYNLGETYLNMNLFYNSRYYFFKSLLLSQKFKYDNTLLLSIKSLTSLYKLQEKYKEALYFNEVYYSTKLDIEKNGKEQYFKKLEILKLYRRKFSTKNDFKSRIYSIIDENISYEGLTSSYIASKLGISAVIIQRRLKEIQEDSLAKIILKRRLHFSKRILQDNLDIKISELAYTCGFNSVDVFSRDFKKEFGQSPSVYKSRKKD